MKLLKTISFLVLFAVIFISCSSNEKIQKKENTKITQNVEKKKIIDNRYKNNPLVASYDVNKDGNADMWKIYQVIKTNNDETKKILSRREIDLNFDGKVNYYKFYSQKGNIKKEYIDLDLNGVIDTIRYYEKNLIIKEENFKKNPLNKDLTINEKIKPYKRYLYKNQKLNRILIDRTNNGVLDSYLFFRKNKLMQIGFDNDDDGKIDTRVRLKPKVNLKKAKEKDKNDK